MLILGIYSFSTYSEGICSVGKARVALSSSAGPQGGSLPAAVPTDVVARRRGAWAGSPSSSRRVTALSESYLMTDICSWEIL